MIYIKLEIRSWLKSDIYIYLILVILLIIGISRGCFSVVNMKDNDIRNLREYINSFFCIIGNEEVNREDIMLKEFFNNTKLLSILWISGSSIIGMPVIFYLIYIKGYILGFCSGLIIKSMGLKGITLITIGMVPKEIFLIPIVMILSVNSIKFSKNMIQDSKFKSFKSKKILEEFSKYSLVTAVFIIISFVVSLVNSYILTGIAKIII